MRIAARHRLLLLALLSAPGLVACEGWEESDPDARCAGGRCDGWTSENPSPRWALDMRKVRASGAYQDGLAFLGARPEQLGLDMSKVPAALRPVVCQPAAVIGEGGAVSEGQCALWGNMMRLNYDHSVHVDDPARRPMVNAIDEEGNHLDPPGYLNIIPMYETCEDEQTELLGALRNGDVLVYFHPEDSDTTQLRMHHAAMYYETAEGPLALALDGPRFVHHIDNPESYGPAFTGGDHSTPFHVFRLDPRNVSRSLGGGRYEFTSPSGAEIVLTDDMAEMYGYAARNWALLTNDHAPFADFHDMTWSDAGRRQAEGRSVLDEVDRYARPALERGEIPQVYCAGLVFSNLNLALNRPMSRSGLGPLWSSFEGRTFEFDDGYFNADLAAADLAAGVEDLPSLDRLVFEPILASDILDMWLETYVRGPLDPETGETNLELEASLRQLRAQILGGGAEMIADGFSSLDWAATKDSAGRSERSVVATPERIRTYASVYAQMPGQDNLTITVGSTASGLDLVVAPGADGQPDVEQIKELERRYVENRYVPPPVYHVMANRRDSMISYVGTVIPVGLLTRIDPEQPGVDIATGDIPSATCDRYRQGGPDSSLYEHYAVPDGGRHVQRVFGISSGPYQLAAGTKVVTRLSAADVRDVRILLHPPGSFGPLDDLYACERDPGCIGNARGILLPLDPAMNGGQTVWDDVTVTFDLFSPAVGCTLTEDGRTLCPVYSAATDAPGTGEADRLEIESAYGQWTISVSDLGETNAGADVPNCIECPRGGAHTNQWVLVIFGDGSGSGGDGGEWDGEDEWYANCEATAGFCPGYWYPGPEAECVCDPGEPWIGSLCTTDEHCAFSSGGRNGRCERWGEGPGYCSIPCEGTCPDREYTAGTFCVESWEGGRGVCVPKADSDYNGDCEWISGTRATTASRWVGSSGAAARTATVCLPVLP